MNFAVAGLFLAVGTLHHLSAPPIMHLRNLNPYVATALEDWDNQSGSHPSAPRQEQTIANANSTVGTSSFGMSGVNAHVLLGPSDGIHTLVQV